MLLKTDALPDRSQDELLLNSPPNEFKTGHLELSLDSNAPDVEKELMLLQQELAEMNSQLKVMCVACESLLYSCGS